MNKHRFNEVDLKNLQHLYHPFYQQVDEYVKQVAVQQVMKGAEKYDEPFNPDSWTSDELSNHAMQELRDAQVYTTGMRDRMRKLERENLELKSMLSHAENEIEELKRRLGEE